MAKKNGVRAGEICISHETTKEHSERLGVCHCHDEYELLYVVRGSGKYVVEGLEYPIKPRTMMVIPPLQYHCVRIDEDTVYERYVVSLSKDDITDEVGVLLDDFATAPGTFYAADLLSDTTVTVFERLEASESMPESGRKTYKKLLASELILLLSISQRENPMIDEGELGARVIHYINEHINRDVSLDKLAKHFFVSKYYLCRAFKKHNGISVHGYINQKRVMYAKQLIEAGETASSAAYRVGFGDYSAFYRAYVKIVGTAPTSKET